MPDAYLLHRFLRRIAAWALVAFFTEIHVVGGENVPRKGPIIVTATHHNMMIDPAILSCVFPHQRILHFWAKASLFANPVMKYILTSAGNIPVDRKARDRQKLFHGTVKALAQGHAVALFPEGTSYTEPRIVQVKDGAAYAALEYAKFVKEHPDQVKRGAETVQVITAAIAYTNKTKYRSNAIMEFGPPISVEPFLEQFMSSEEGAARAAAKRLTAAIEQQLIETTINASDWDTLYAARMARDLLWVDPKSIKLDEFVLISQTLVDLFSTTDLVPNLTAIKRYLLTYYSLLQSTNLTNSALAALALPETLDPQRPIPLPSRLFTLSLLIRDTLALLIRLPFFLGPSLLHIPVYIASLYGAMLAEDEEETQAQNKVVFGFLLLLLIYPATFFFLWALLWYTPFGAFVAASVVTLVATYHTKLVNDNYEHAKRLVATWRVLVGVWIPKRWDLSLQALSQYTVPRVPPENEWIDRSKIRQRNTPAPAATPSSSSPIPTPASTQSGSPSASPSAPGSSRKRRRPPTRRLIRHVLRARVEAAKALASLFEQLEKGQKDKRVYASPHLARAFGGHVEQQAPPLVTDDGVEAPPELVGWRSAGEVVDFLRERGARIAALEDRVEGDWAALSTDMEGDSDMVLSEAERENDTVWVQSTQNL